MMALVQGIVAVAYGDESPHPAIEVVLTQMEEDGWMLRGPVAQIWAGERAAAGLTVGLEVHATALVALIRERLAEDAGRLRMIHRLVCRAR